MLPYITGAALGAQNSTARLYESRLVREHDRLHPVAKIKLLENAGDVGLDGCLAEVELPGDLGVREAASDHPHDLELTPGQLDKAGRDIVGPGHQDELLDTAPRDRRGEEGFGKGPHTWNGWIHDLAFVAVALSAITGMAATALALSGNERWRGFRVAALLVALSIPVSLFIPVSRT